jgi:hypothetical protein
MVRIDEWHAESLLTAMVQVWQNIENNYYKTEDDIQDMALMVEKTLLPKFNQIVAAENLKGWIAAKRTLVLSAQAAMINAQDYFIKHGLIPKAQAIAQMPVVELGSIRQKLGIIASMGIYASQAQKTAGTIESQRPENRVHYTTMASIRRDLDSYLIIYIRNVAGLLEVLNDPAIDDIKAKEAKALADAIDSMRRLAAWIHSLIALGVEPYEPPKKKEFAELETAVAAALKKQAVAV